MQARFKTLHGKQSHNIAIILDTSLSKLYRKFEKNQVENDLVLFWQKKLLEQIEHTEKLIKEMNEECNIKTI